MLLILSRHGETEENIRRELQGQLPGTLSVKGLEQADGLADAMQDIPLDAVVCSDLSRSSRTAEIVAAAKGLQCYPTPLLREMDWGIYTGQQLTDVDWYHLPDGVENIGCLYERAQRFLDFLKREFAGKTVLAVGHGAFNRAIETVLSGKTPWSMVELPIMKNVECKYFEI